MKKIIFFINLLVIIFVTSLPTNNSNNKSNIFQEFKKHSASNCPDLDKSFLSDPTSKYFEECTAFPTDTNLTGFNTDKFFCIGVLDAEYKLCNILGSRKLDLPRNIDSLNKEIAKISKLDKVVVCQSLQKINETAETLTKPYVQQLNGVLKNNENCSKFCQSIFTNTNNFCSLISYIYSLIDQVKALDVTEKSSPDQSVTELKNIAPISNDNKITPTTSAKVPKSEENPTLTNVQVKKTEVDSKTISTQVQTNPKNYLIENTQLQAKVESKSPSQNSQVLSSTSVKTTIKSKTVLVGNNFEQDGSQIDKNQLKQQLKPQENGVGTGIAEEQKFDKEVQLTNNFEESKEDGALQNEDMNYDEDNIMSEIKNEQNSKDNLAVTPRKEVIEKDSPEKILISAGQKYPTQYEDPEDSNFFTYFMFISVLFIGVYIAYHNKQKILALVLEGRRDRNSRRRPNTASYRKLNSNLEEAVTSKSGGSASNIIY